MLIASNVPRRTSVLKGSNGLGHHSIYRNRYQGRLPGIRETRKDLDVSKAGIMCIGQGYSINKGVQGAGKLQVISGT